jgi:hypothetical protein
MELFLLTTYTYCFFAVRPKTSLVVADVPGIHTTPSVCFSGCACQFNFYAGVNKYILEHFDHTKMNCLCVSGGAFAAAPLLLGIKTEDWINRNWQRCYDYYSRRRWNIWFDTTDFMRDNWRFILPEDAYKICTDRLFIQISRLGIYGFYPELVHKFESNEDLIDAILCSSHILGMFTTFPRFRGRWGFDGSFTNLQPQFNDRFSPQPTIVVKLFGRGTIDYKNKIPLYKLTQLTRPKSCNRLLMEAYDITKGHHEHISTILPGREEYFDTTSG